MPKGLPQHSPVGGSAVERLMECAGSVREEPYADDLDDDSEHSTLGTAAHALLENCLRRNDDAFTKVGWAVMYDGLMREPADDWPGKVIVVDKPMADAVQVALNAIRLAHPDRNQGNFFIEHEFHCPRLHKLFYGRVDAAALELDKRLLYIDDYKHGAGIVVDVQWNGQLMYYAIGMLEQLDLWDKIDRVVLRIIQPRGFHSSGPIREWSVSVADLKGWLYADLLPAMVKALESDETKSGEHCRFCPRRLRGCPQLAADAMELEIMTLMAQDGKIERWSPEQVGHFLDLGETFKILRKAAEKVAFHMMNHGNDVPNWKLAQARANRVFKDGAEAEAIATFGRDRAYTKPELKSPAQIEALDGGEAFVARWAEKPDAGLTVVRASDSRRGVSKDTKALFTAVKK